ncbi:MAG: M48 family metalloprotease [Terriglobales bacterium]|jgi:hypothetical protein
MRVPFIFSAILTAVMATGVAPAQTVNPVAVGQTGSNGRAAIASPQGTMMAALQAAPEDPAGTQTAAAPAASTPAPGSLPPARNPEQVIDRMEQRERAEVMAMQKYHPMVETYLQYVRPDDDVMSAPAKDIYFLGRLTLDNQFHDSFFLDVAKTGFRADVERSLAPLRKFDTVHRFWTIDFLPVGFAAMIFPDVTGFDKNNYTFQFLRREFLGDVRCFVFNATPKDANHRGRFRGRVWIEDKDYNIVRFNGVYIHQAMMTRFFHFDSWRNNIRPGVWLPAQVYSEESEAKVGVQRHKVRFRAQTRFWGYDLKHSGRQEEFSEIEIEPEKDVQDESDKGTDFSPLMSLRAWEREGEDNVVDRLEQAGLVAPPGPVDKILEQIVTNVEAGNDLDVEPEVRCRVLLTAPLESASIGHTILISRGLLDVLPDEGSLAMILTHELGHIVRGEQIDTKYSFGDRMQFNDNVTFQKFPFQRTAEQEQEADKKAVELLKKSIYADKLKSAGLFLRQLQQRAADLPQLTKAHLGNGLVENGQVTRMPELMQGAPELKPRDLSQIPALPLGGRIKINAWDGRVELLKAKPALPNFPSEKMPLEIAPAVMRLTRLEGVSAVPSSGAVAK